MSLTTTINPTNATNSTITWSSDKSTVATVSNGRVTAIAEGKATITATTSNGKKASITITVPANVVPVVAGTSTSE